MATALRCMTSQYASFNYIRLPNLPFYPEYKTMNQKKRLLATQGLERAQVIPIMRAGKNIFAQILTHSV